MNSDRRYIDLHVHTNYSDGTFSPVEVVRYAIEIELTAIAITDHDCVDGIPPAMDEAKDRGLEIIPGLELAAEIEDFEIHIIGLMIDWKDPWLKEQLREIRNARKERMKKMIEKLNNLGIGIKLEQVMALGREEGAVGRLHLARALLEGGYIHSIRQAFVRFIGRNGPCYEKRMILSPQKAIEMIKRVKGIPIFAHPGNMRHDEIIPELMEYGLMGIEVLHIDHNSNASNHYKQLAQNHGLLLSGGSDCHGAGKGYPLMGRVEVPYSFLETLKEAQKKEYGVNQQ
ncbi:MAG: PHP domain-containing protein [Candidatus Omnitrophica bacterium]|nr:PHP domain-containing protein [Candidatus Omnitrophota bacterium]